MSNLSPKEKFNSYCEDKIKPLNKTLDKFGNSYQTFMKGTINGLKNCSIVGVKEHYNDLCWIDQNGNINIADSSSSYVYAIAERFDEIDKTYYEKINQHWNNLKLDVLDYIIFKPKSRDNEQDYSI